MNKNLIKNYKRTRKRDGNFYGTPGVEVEFYGGRGPEFYSATIFYKGYEFNYFDVEDELYDMCKEEYGKKADDDDFFERYVQKNVKHLLDEMIYTGEVEKEDSYKDTRRKPMRRDVRTTLHGSKRARKERDTLRNRKPLREHDSIIKEKTFIVKARNEKDAVLKLKRYLKK